MPREPPLSFPELSFLELVFLELSLRATIAFSSPGIRPPSASTALSEQTRKSGSTRKVTCLPRVMAASPCMSAARRPGQKGRVSRRGTAANYGPSRYCRPRTLRCADHVPALIMVHCLFPPVTTGLGVLIFVLKIQQMRRGEGYDGPCTGDAALGQVVPAQPRRERLRDDLYGRRPQRSHHRICQTWFRYHFRCDPARKQPEQKHSKNIAGTRK